MKNIVKFIWVIALALMVMPSCNEDFLEIPVLVNQSADNFDPATAVTACYNININSTAGEYPNLRWMNWQTFIQGDVISDDAFKSGSGFDDQPDMRQMELFNTLPGNAQTTNFWQVQYIKIYYMNWALSGINQNITISDELKNRYTAEVMFLRSLNYLLLNRVFGGVVPVFELGAGNALGRVSEADIYTRLEEDLIFAISILPEKNEYPVADLGRVTKGAARALLAKIYLYQQKNQECFDMCNQIIQSGQYSLESDYSNLWKRGLSVGRNEHGTESIFEFSLGPNPEQSNNADWALSMRPREAMFGTQTGWGLNNPTLDLLDEFEIGDPRIVSTFLFHGDSMLTVEGDAKFEVNATNYPSNEHRMYNHKIIRKLTLNEEYNANNGENLIILRYADVLLMYAEAANEIGNAGEAVQKLNMVRQRARNSARTDYRREYINFNGKVDYNGPERNFLNYDWHAVNQSIILPDVSVTAKEDLRKAIWHERRVELALEGERFYDLARQSRVEPNRIGNMSYSPFHKLRLIYWD